jgi:hypothetical protein
VDFVPLGRVLIVAGVVLAVFGLLLVGAGKGILPRLPGDLSFTVGNLRVFFPVATSILISVLLTLFLTFIARK